MGELDNKAGLAGKALSRIQTALKVGKPHFNAFGKYNYRKAEDIFDAIKPLLAKHECSLVLSDDVFVANDRVYIKSTARLTHSDGSFVENVAFAREPASKKGMDDSQVTGTASSYARKSCLDGMLCLSDGFDAEALVPESEIERVNESQAIQIKSLLDDTGSDIAKFLTFVRAKDIESIKSSEYDKIHKMLSKKLKDNPKSV